MKKLVLLFVCLFTMQAVAWADDDKPVKVEQMPHRAQQFIKKHFSDNSIAIAKMESDLFSKSYDVIFTNGDKVEFDKKGEWKEIDCKYSQVPMEIVPTAIKNYITKQYPDAKIVKIEKDDRGYEVKLATGWEVKFDKKLNVIDIDR